jgi:hypothetical protein
MLPSWSRNGQAIYFNSDRSGAPQIWKIAAQGGAAVQVTRKGGFNAFEALDGKSLYYYRERAIWTSNLSGEEESRVADSPGFQNWRLCGEAICFLDDNVSPAQLSILDLVTVSNKRVGTVDVGPAARAAMGFSISPDRHWAIYTRVDSMDSDIMLVENFR